MRHEPGGRADDVLEGCSGVGLGLQSQIQLTELVRYGTRSITAAEVPRPFYVMSVVIGWTPPSCRGEPFTGPGSPSPDLNDQHAQATKPL